jgi:sugar/nucleoside kinase (ribokinase family)
VVVTDRALRGLVIGTVTLDVINAPDSADARVSVGGTGANIAIRLAHDGWQVELAGVIGQDRAGDIIRSQLDAHGVRMTWLRGQPGYPTPHVFQTSVPGVAAPVFSNDCVRCGARRAQLMTPTGRPVLDALARYAAVADAVVTDLPSPAADAAFAAGGALLWYEIGLMPPSAAEHDIIARASVIKGSRDEIDVGRLPADRRAIITEGASGSLFRLPAQPSRWHRVPAVQPVCLVDTMGAGDAFSAAVLTCVASQPDRLASPVGMSGALHRAAVAAAAVCEYSGALGDLPHVPIPQRLRADSYGIHCGVCDPGVATGEPSMATGEKA